MGTGLAERRCSDGNSSGRPKKAPMHLPSPWRAIALPAVLVPALALSPAASCLAQSTDDAASPAAPAPAPAASSSLFRPTPVPSGEKSYWIPAAEIVTFDLLLSNFNRATCGCDDYDVTWDTIKRNLKGPWVVDSDPFSVNQFGHPYQGSLYHGMGRSMGLGYWESAALTFLGSAWWEITGEATPPSRNDQIASGIAGSFLGEPLFRMSHLVGDHSTLPPEWRPWLAAAISPPAGFNRWMFGPDRYGAVFDDHDPAYYGRWHLGVMHATQADFAPSDDVERNTAQLDYRLDYGLPGKPGYTYNRPFDYFDFEIALSSKNGMEILATDGLLLGDHFAIGHAFSGIAGVYGGYEYLSPQLYHVSDTSASIGTNVQWWLGRDVALQASALGGVAYAAVSSTVRDIDSSEYHYGSAPRLAAALRLIDADRASLDVSGRYLALGRIAQRDAGRDSVSRLEAAFTWRLVGHHAIGVQYAWSHRSATYNGGAERKQTLGQIGLFYTLLGQQDFGAVAWRPDD
jgi:hypothetical protein